MGDHTMRFVERPLEHIRAVAIEGRCQTCGITTPVAVADASTDLVALRWQLTPSRSCADQARKIAVPA